MPPKKPFIKRYAVFAVSGLLAAGFSVFYIHKYIDGMAKQIKLKSVQKELAKSKMLYARKKITFTGYVGILISLLSLLVLVKEQHTTREKEKRSKWPGWEIYHANFPNRRGLFNNNN